MRKEEIRGRSGNNWREKCLANTEIKRGREGARWKEEERGGGRGRADRISLTSRS